MAQPITNFTELDFFRARANLIAFLRTKTEFNDFDFAGSANSILIDAVTYVTNQMAAMSNMALSEVFLDSASLRSNVVSHAKALGYNPRSQTAAYAELVVSINLGPLRAGLTDIVIPRGAKFAATINGQSFNFVTLDRFPLEDLGGDGIYTAAVTIYEGILTKQVFTYKASVVNQLFTLSNKNIDNRFISINVRANAGSSNITEYFPAENIVAVDRESNVFFIQEGIDGFWQIYFGDNIIGAQPAANSIIEVEYLVTKGAGGNGISAFSMLETLTRNPAGEASESFAGSSFSVNVIDAAGYGSEAETTESIKASAPKFRKAQNRAVTKEDYVSLINANFGFVETMSVWGGQDAVPPQYGKVLISIKPKYGDYLSPLTKARIKQLILDKYAIIGITPEVVDPDFTFIYVDTNVLFRKEETTLSDGELNSLVSKAITDFFTSGVSFFDGVFRYSKFVAAIDDTDISIKGNNTTLRMAKIFKPTPGVVSEFTFSFFNAMKPGTVESQLFLALSGQTTQIKDDALGNLDLYINGALFKKAVGSINYTLGKVYIPRLSFDIAANTQIILYAQPLNDDLFTVRNNLIILKGSNINMVRLGS